MKQKHWLILAIAAVSTVGLLFSWWMARVADGQIRKVLLDQARLVSRTIEMESLRRFSGTEADLVLPDYLRLKERLALIRTVNSKCRFIYLMGRRGDGSIFFFVDSEPASSKDYSPPGQTYEEVTEDFRRLFDTTQAEVQGPVTDRWGSWISALVPLVDPQSGTVRAVLGMDIEVSTWKGEIVAKAILPIVLMTLVLVFGLFLIVLQQSNREIRRHERELRESQDRYSNFIANAGEGIFRIDLVPPVRIDQPEEVLKIQIAQRAVVGEVNAALSDMYGLSPDRMVGHAVTEFAPNCGTQMADLIGSTGYRIAEREEMEVSADGKPVYIVESYRGVVEEGMLKRVWGVQRNITERKLAEEALRKSEENYRTLFETMGQGVVYQATDGRILSANPAAERILGLSLEQMQGKKSIDPTWRSIHEDGSPFPGEEHPAMVALRTGESVQGVIMGVYHATENEYRWLWIDAVPEFLPGEQRPYRVYTTFSDITDRKMAEEALRESRDRLQSIFRIAPTGIGVVRDRTLLEVNQRICKMTGYTPQELIGRSSRIFYPTQEDFDYVGKEKYRQIAETGTGMVETRWRRKDGSIIDVLLASTPMNPPDLSKGVTFTALDITDRKRLEEALKRRLVTLTQPLENTGIVFEDLFDIDEIQHIQDEFAEATGVASLITRTDGTPITKPSHFTRLCRDVIRKSEQGRKNCMVSDAALGRMNENGPNTQPCLSGGLWGAGASIVVGGRHIANWLIGQVRNEAQTEDKLRAYAREIGVDEETLIDAFREVPSITREQFDHVAQALFALAKQLSTSAYQNILQARFITDRQRAEEALRISEERFRSVIEASPMGMHMYRLDSEGRLLFEGANPAADRILGVDHGQLIGKTMEKAFPQLSQTEIPASYREVALGRGLWQTSMIDYQDEKIKGAFEVYAFQTGTNTMAAFFLDVTERLVAQERIRQSEQKFRDMAEQLEDVLFVTDDKGTITYLSPAFEKLFGWRVEEMTGRLFVDFLPEDQTPIALAEFQKALAGGLHARPLDLVIKRKEGGTFLGELNSTVVRRNNQIVGTMGLIRDITERKRAEEALRESEERWQFALEGAGDGVWDWNAQTNRVLFTSQWKRMLGFEVHEIGDGLEEWDQRLHPEDRDYVYAELNRHLEGKTPTYSSEHRLRCKDGTYKWILDRGKVVNRRPDGKPLRVIGTHTDITDRKRAEEEKTRLEAQLQQAMKMEAVGRLAGGVAHDFNNLLTSISGYTEILLGDLHPGDPMHTDLLEVKKAAERAAALTAQLLAFSRKQVIDPRLIDLNELLAGAIKMLQRLIGEDIELIFLPGKTLGSVRIDPHQIEQVIINLAVNARDAMPEGGKLMIETFNVEIDEEYAHRHLDAKTGHYVLLTMSDNGCGMPAEIQEHLFEPFFTTKEKGKGTGLGLSMIYGIVQQNSGFINVYSEVGVGTVFKIYLPLVSGKVEPIRKGFLNVLPTGTETILLVEDEEMVRNLAQKVLERQGYKVHAVNHGGQAFLLAENPAVTFDLLLTDVIMPDINGRQLYEKLHALRPALRVLYMSGYTENTIAHHGVLDEGTNFLQKPFPIDGLVRKVREVLDQKT